MLPVQLAGIGIASVYTGSALFSCPSPSGCPQPHYTSLGLSSGAELHLCSQMDFETHLHLSVQHHYLWGSEHTWREQLESEQPMFFTVLQTQVRCLKGLWTTGSQQPSGPIILQSKVVTLPCLERTTGSPKTFPQIDLGCSKHSIFTRGKEPCPSLWIPLNLLLGKSKELSHLPPLPPAPQVDESCTLLPAGSTVHISVLLLTFWESLVNKSFLRALPSLIAKITLSLMHPKPLVTLQIAPNTQLWCLETPLPGFVSKVPLPFCCQNRFFFPDWHYLGIG